MKKPILFLIFALLAPGLAHAEPVSAIMAVGSMLASGGVAAIGAGGLAGLTSLTLANGLLFAGGAIGLLGSVTKNKKLTALGGVLSLGGGIGNLVAGAAGGAGAAGAAVKEAGAGSAALGQTAIAPAEAITEGVTQGVEGAAGGAAEAAGTMGATPASGLGAGGGAANLAPLAQEGAGGSLLDKLVNAAGKTGSFITKNKELVNLGGGLIKGAAEGYAASNAAAKLREDQAAFLREQQQRYSSSVTGINPVGQFVNPNANIMANTTIQDPTRYVPNRGIIRSTQGG